MGDPLMPQTTPSPTDEKSSTEPVETLSDELARFSTDFPITAKLIAKVAKFHDK